MPAPGGLSALLDSWDVLGAPSGGVPEGRKLSLQHHRGRQPHPRRTCVHHHWLLLSRPQASRCASELPFCPPADGAQCAHPRDVLANNYDVHRLIAGAGLQLEPAFTAGLVAAWSSDFQAVTSSAAAVSGLGSAIRGIRAHGASFAPALGALALHQQGGSVGLGSSGPTERAASDAGAHEPESASTAAQRSFALFATLRIGATAGSVLLADVTSDAF